MNARDNGENWVVIGPSHVELGPQVPAMVGNQSLTLPGSKITKFAITIVCAKI